MKILYILLSLAALSLPAVACDDDASTNNGNDFDPVEICDTICRKKVACGTDALDSCKVGCEALFPWKLESYGTIQASCYESHTCTELEAMNPSCRRLAAESCDTNLDDLRVTMCGKDFECLGLTADQAQIDACVAQYEADGDFQASFECYTPAAISGYSTCVAEVTCGNQEADMDACGVVHLGWILYK
ncbi:hypothetical protein KJ975_06620 [Myxococcota bacterium]|nr:hypothetical protein [Myxococcota bacterium]